jgi:hypothetical protein
MNAPDEEEIAKKYNAYIEFYVQYNKLPAIDKPPLKSHLDFLLDEWLKAKNKLNEKNKK